MEFMKKNAKTIAILSAIVAIISLFLPYATAKSVFGNINFTFIEGDGKIVLVLMIISTILIFINKKSTSIASIVLTILSLLIAFINIFNVGKLDSGSSYVTVSLSIGLFLLLLSLVINAMSLVFNLKNNN